MEDKWETVRNKVGDRQQTSCKWESTQSRREGVTREKRERWETSLGSRPGSRFPAFQFHSACAGRPGTPLTQRLNPRHWEFSSHLHGTTPTLPETINLKIPTNKWLGDFALREVTVEISSPARMVCVPGSFGSG